MTDRVVTLTLSDNLYKKTQRLIEEGMFTDLDEIVRAGLRQVLLEAAIIEGQSRSSNIDSPEQYRHYLQKIRQGVADSGSLFPGQTPDEVMQNLRQTRDELYEEKYAAHFRHK